MERLVHGDESIKEVAAGLGFSSAQYFRGAFKKQSGELPSQYRKRIRAKIEAERVAQTEIPQLRSE